MHAARMIMLAGTFTALSCPVFAQDSEIERHQEFDRETVTNKIAEMIIDLGGFGGVRANNGKTMRCSNGGTKRISIVERGPTRTYTGDYRNCREKGTVRDGKYEFILKGEEIISSTVNRSKNGKLFDAALAGDGNMVRELIRDKADVNYTESISKTDGGEVKEWTPLMSAVMKGNPDVVRQLVEAGAWVNYLNSMVVNAFWIAANTGHLDIVKYLAAHGAYINNRNIEEVTPLMAAAMNGHTDVVKFLISAKANLNSGHKDGDTALMFALAGRHTAIARMLVDAGADVNIRNRFGTTALLIAVAEGSAEGVEMLLKRKADVNVRTTDGLNALDVAKARKLTGIVEILEKAGR